jgi:D-glycero-D-manno-heptose 1,7-bisphosphate phosphatase
LAIILSLISAILLLRFQVNSTWLILAGALIGLLLKQLGYRIVILTNQNGIEKGLYTEYDVNILHAYMTGLLGRDNIDGIYYAKNKNDYYAKPNIGMFKQAEEELSVDFSQGYFVGDKITDLEAAINVNAIPILVRTGYGKKTEKELEDYPDIKKRVLVFNTLFDFALSLSFAPS